MLCFLGRGGRELVTSTNKRTNHGYTSKGGRLPTLKRVINVAQAGGCLILGNTYLGRETNHLRSRSQCGQGGLRQGAGEGGKT